MNEFQSRVLELARRIASLEEQLEAAKREFISLVPGQPVASVAPRPDAQSTTDSLAHRIVTYLEKTPDKAFGADEVAQVLGADNPKTVRTTLARLARDGTIAKERRGWYRGLRPGEVLPPLPESDEDGDADAVSQESSEGQVPEKVRPVPVG